MKKSTLKRLKKLEAEIGHRHKAEWTALAECMTDEELETIIAQLKVKIDAVTDSMDPDEKKEAAELIQNERAKVPKFLNGYDEHMWHKKQRELEGCSDEELSKRMFDDDPELLASCQARLAAKRAAQ